MTHSPISASSTTPPVSSTQAATHSSTAASSSTDAASSRDHVDAPRSKSDLRGDKAAAALTSRQERVAGILARPVPQEALLDARKNHKTDDFMNAVMPYTERRGAIALNAFADGSETLLNQLAVLPTRFIPAVHGVNSGSHWAQHPGEAAAMGAGRGLAHILVGALVGPATSEVAALMKQKGQVSSLGAYPENRLEAMISSTKTALRIIDRAAEKCRENQTQTPPALLKQIEQWQKQLQDATVLARAGEVERVGLVLSEVAKTVSEWVVGAATKSGVPLSGQLASAVTAIVYPIADGVISAIRQGVAQHEHMLHADITGPDGKVDLDKVRALYKTRPEVVESNADLILSRDLEDELRTATHAQSRVLMLDAQLKSGSDEEAGRIGKLARLDAKIAHLERQIAAEMPFVDKDRRDAIRPLLELSNQIETVREASMDVTADLEALQGEKLQHGGAITAEYQKYLGVPHHEAYVSQLKSLLTNMGLLVPETGHSGSPAKPITVLLAPITNGKTRLRALEGQLDAASTKRKEIQAEGAKAQGAGRESTEPVPGLSPKRKDLLEQELKGAQATHSKAYVKAENKIKDIQHYQRASLAIHGAAEAERRAGEPSTQPDDAAKLRERAQRLREFAKEENDAIRPDGQLAKILLGNSSSDLRRLGKTIAAKYAMPGDVEERLASRVHLAGALAVGLGVAYGDAYAAHPSLQLSNEMSEPLNFGFKPTRPDGSPAYPNTGALVDAAITAQIGRSATGLVDPVESEKSSRRELAAGNRYPTGLQASSPAPASEKLVLQTMLDSIKMPATQQGSTTLPAGPRGADPADRQEKLAALLEGVSPVLKQRAESGPTLGKLQSFMVTHRPMDPTQRSMGSDLGGRGGSLVRRLLDVPGSALMQPFKHFSQFKQAVQRRDFLTMATYSMNTIQKLEQTVAPAKYLVDGLHGAALGRTAARLASKAPLPQGLKHGLEQLAEAPIDTAKRHLEQSVQKLPNGATALAAAASSESAPR